MPNLDARIEQAELMDTMAVDGAEMRETLRFLGLTARRFGGNQVVLRRLREWSAAWPRNAAVSILDVGTGGADIPMAIAEWARSEKRRVRIVAIDLIPDIITIARARAARYPEIEVRCEDAFNLARRGEQFDYATASLFLHHMPTDRITEVLALFDRLSRRGVIVSDLERSLSGYWAVTALAYLAGNRIVRHDGPLSVRRSFRIEELAAYADAAGLGYLQASREPWFRLSLAGEKP